MSNVEIRDAFSTLNQLMMTQAQFVPNHVVNQTNLGVEPQPNASSPASRIRDFTRINPSTFHVTKVDEYL